MPAKKRAAGHAKGSPKMTPTKVGVIRLGTDGRLWRSRKMASGKFGWKLGLKSRKSTSKAGRKRPCKYGESVKTKKCNKTPRTKHGFRGLHYYRTKTKEGMGRAVYATAIGPARS